MLRTRRQKTMNRKSRLSCIWIQRALQTLLNKMSKRQKSQQSSSLAHRSASKAVTMGPSSARHQRRANLVSRSQCQPLRRMLERVRRQGPPTSALPPMEASVTLVVQLQRPTQKLTVKGRIKLLDSRIIRIKSHWRLQRKVQAGQPQQLQWLAQGTSIYSMEARSE